MTTNQAYRDLDGKDTWLTPAWLIDALEYMKPIETDPCAGVSTSIGATYNHRLSDGEDGFSEPWTGRTFVNPPFGEKKEWIQETYQRVRNSEKIDTAFVLLPGSVTAWWFHDLVWSRATALWIPKGRISYVDPETGETMNQPAFGSVLAVYGQLPAETLGQLEDGVDGYEAGGQVVVP